MGAATILCMVTADESIASLLDLRKYMPQNQIVITTDWVEACAHFASIEEDDIATLLSNKDSLSTKKASINAVGVLQFY